MTASTVICTLHPVCGGQHAPCNCYIDATVCLVAETVLSGLAIAARSGNDTYVVAALLPENIPDVLTLIRKWWHVDVYAAPDTDTAPAPPDTEIIRPPTGLTWLDLHLQGEPTWPA